MLTEWSAFISCLVFLVPVVQGQPVNLIRNGGFEAGGVSWTMAVSRAEADRALITAKDPYRGERALFLDAVGIANEVGAWSQPAPVLARRSYRLRAWVKQTAGYSQYKIVIDWRNAAGKHISYSNNWKGNNCPTEYAPHGGDFLAPDGATQAVLLVGVAAGSACLMDELSLTLLRSRGADIHVYLFCQQADAAGEFAVQARIQNDGDRPATALQARLDLPTGLSCDDAERSLATVRPGEHKRLEWIVGGDSKTINAPLKVHVRAEGVEPEEASTLPFVTRCKIARSDGSGAPAPCPAKSDIVVGTYYFPVMLDWERAGWGVRHVDYFTPMLGYYNETLPEVADWHIKWAVEHGLDFFAFDWYYNDGSRYLHDALEKGFLRSRCRSRMKFCINWCNEGQATWDRPLSFSTESLRGFMTYLCEHYLDRPEYLRVDGRPLVMILHPDPIIERHGGPDGSRAALDQLRNIARQHGHPDLYLMCIGLAERSDFYRRAGYDGVTAYSYGWGDAQRYENGDCDYEDLLPEHERAWSAALRNARSGGLGYMPVVWSGWDDYPRAHERVVRTRGNTAARFRAMCEAAARYVDPQINLLIIEAWNEWGEGGFLEPSEARGFSFLDAVRDVLTEGRGPHTDVVPTPEQVASYDTALTFAEIDADYIRRDRLERGAGPIAAMDWQFSAEGDLDGWNVRHHLARPVVQGGCLRSRSTGGDPAMFGPALMDVSARQYRALEIRMRVDRGQAGQVFWKSDDSPTFTEEASLSFKLLTDGGLHIYRIPLADNEHWRGTIRQIRLDPTNVKGAHIAIDYVRGVE